MMSTVNSIGIIGYGRFGSLLAKTFSSRTNCTVKVFDPSYIIDNKSFLTLEDVCNSEIVIPAVPISEFENVIQALSLKLKAKSLLVDVCSVKVFPSEVMLKYLPENIDILASHPMFGPDSTRNGESFENLKFIWAKVRVQSEEKVEWFLNFWRNLGCDLIELSPSEHDKQAAYTHAYAFLIGKIGIHLDVRRNHISTKGFEGVLYNQEAVENDTSQLFDDLMNYNPYAKKMRNEFSKALEKIEKELSSKGTQT